MRQIATPAERGFDLRPGKTVPPYARAGETVNSTGQYYAADGTFMNADGSRSIFDDVDDEAEADFDDRTENTAAIAADGAGSVRHTQVIARAVAAHGRAWPEQLTSGVMFYDGERITKAEFMAEVRG